MRWLKITVAVLESRKTQVAIGTIVATIAAVFGFRDLDPELVAVIVLAIAGIGGVLINAIKAEDVASKTAAGVVGAAQVQSENTTTVSTPSDNVTVTTEGK